MAWRRPGNKPLSEAMMVRFETHICITRPKREAKWPPTRRLRSQFEVIIKQITYCKNIQHGLYILTAAHVLLCIVVKYIEQKKKRTSISTENLIIVETAQINCLVWVKSATILLWHFALQQAAQCSKINNGCDKPWVSMLRQVILACGMSAKTSRSTGITVPWFLEVGHVTLFGNQWGPSPMFDGVSDGEYTGQGSVWTAFDLRKSWVRQIEKGKALYRYLVEPCSTLLPIQEASIWSLGAQCKSPEMATHGLCGYSDVLTSRFFCNSFCGWFPLIQ